MLSFLLIVVSSCSSYYFSTPQPADRKDIREFPRVFTGRWTDADDTMERGLQPVSLFERDSSYRPIVWRIEDSDPLAPAPAERQTSFYEVGTDYALFIVHQQEKIIKGAWPRVCNGELHYPDESCNVLQTIRYDSLLRPVDTTFNYIFRGNLIYKIDEDHFLKTGYRFDSSATRITLFKKDTVAVDLGQNAILRKLDERFYALNIRYRVLGDDNNWWLLLILENSDKGWVNIWQCSEKSGGLPSMFYSRPSKADEYFFDSQWTASQLLQLVKDGYFEITNTLIKSR